MFWLLVGGGPYCRWWRVLVDIFWLEVGGGEWWWVVVGRSIVWSNPVFNGNL